jgi:hypothetical protein
MNFSNQNFLRWLFTHMNAEKLLLHQNSCSIYKTILIFVWIGFYFFQKVWYTNRFFALFNWQKKLIRSWNERNLSISFFLRDGRNWKNKIINVYKNDHFVFSIKKCSILSWLHRISRNVLILSLWLQRKIFWLTSDFFTKTSWKTPDFSPKIPDF